MARNSARAHPENFNRSQCVLRYGATDTTLNNEMHIVPALLAGDPWAADVVRQCTRFLARCLVDSIIVAGLRRVVVIGGFALSAGEAYLAILRSTAEECCDYELLKGRMAEMLSLGTVGEEACLLGAAVYAQRVTGS